MTRTSFLCFVLLVGAVAALAAFLYFQQDEALDPVSDRKSVV
jgi:hypothetical protein